MLDPREVCQQIGIERTSLEAWIESGWLRPLRVEDDWRFSAIDLARARFIMDLRDPMGVNDEGVEVILSLLDQIHGLRRALKGVMSRAAGEKPRREAGS
jgi:chaperone modulatory protein CbpM